MKLFTLLLLIHVSFFVSAQDAATSFDGHHWEAPYTLPIPKGWSIERFLIPISFAPQINYTGVEDIRFTPGWADAKSDEYWSYAFLWYLDGSVKMDAATVTNNLKYYYTGLVKVNGGGIPADKIIPVFTSFAEVKAEAGDVKTYAGTVRMLDYMTQKPILLNCKVHQKICDGANKTFMFHELSLQPMTHKVWSSLDLLWKEFMCDKSNPK
ncbi:MAG: hypothetical protein HYZ44_04155 [Bacteroidetes bacterium]|nr:hypothetical protein [Bacteroidota bacterium]